MTLKHQHNQGILLSSAVLFCTSLTLNSNIQFWVLGLSALTFAIRLLLYRGKQKHIPGRVWINILAVLCIIALFYNGMNDGLLNSMLNLLITACSLKLMLLNKPRDVYQLNASLMFLVGCGFIFEQSIFFTGMYFAFALALLLALLMLHSPSLSTRRQMKKLGIWTLQTLPIALLLFVTFPRLPALWQMPTARSATTGLSDTVTAGDFSSLAQSDALVLRATFTGPPPAKQYLYWRALVLESFDGKTWRESPLRKQVRRQLGTRDMSFTVPESSAYYEYEIIAEATQQRWLYALDIAAPADAASRQAIRRSSTYQLMKRTPMVHDFSYRVRSYYQVPLNQTFVSVDQRINLQVPEKGNPQTRAWVASINQQFENKRQRLETILARFKQQPFVYTLRPPLMQRNPVDAFLFTHRQGFCAHYASATAYALRLAEIPARMVTGYQGGEMREARYMSVYQYDAHAWVEVWLDESGWQRIDPTALVAPDRLTQGLQAAVEEEQSFLQQQGFSLRKLDGVAFFRELRMVLADVDFMWSKFVVNFDSRKQTNLFESLLGALTYQKVMLFSVMLVTLTLLFLILIYLPDWRTPRPHPIERCYRAALERVTQHHPRPAWQSASAYADTIRRHCAAQISEPWQELTQIWVKYRYSAAAASYDETDIKRAKECLTRLKQACQPR